MDKIAKIKNLLVSELNSIYCYNCKFQELTEKEAEEKYGPYSYGCDDCHRKNMGWGLSEDTAEVLAKKIQAINSEREEKGEK